MIAEKLRKAILQAAMQGKLTEQLPEDGNARDLLTEIQQEKQRKIKAGEIKATKLLPPIDPEDVPYEIPENWVWTRLGEVYDIGRGGSPRPIQAYISKDNEGYNWIKIGDSEIGGRYIWSTKQKVISSALTKSRLVHPNDLLLTNSMSFGRPYITKIEGLIHDGWLALTPISNRLESEFSFFFLSSSAAFYSFSRSVSGAVVKNLNIDKVRMQVFPVPPFREQYRIVARIESLLSLISELEIVEKELDVLEKEFPEKLKKSLLQAAMQGKLTEQLSEDGDAKDLLAEIQREKKRKIKAGAIKAAKPLPPIDPDEIPYEIPENWVWTKLGNIGTWKAGSTPRRSNISFYSNGTIPWLVTGDLNDGVITTTKEKISVEAVHKTGLVKHDIGTVLMAMYGATIGKLGILGISATTNQACIACSLKKGIDNWYLFYYLMYSRDKFRLMGAGGAQPNISKQKILPFHIPLPPLNEQRRIVSVLDKLLPLCEGLRQP